MPRQVMISHNQVHVQPSCGLCRGKGANARIHADNQANAGLGGALDHVIFHSITLANAMRNMEIRRAAAQFNGGLQNDNRRSAIDVVVAVRSEEHTSELQSRQYLVCRLQLEKKKS